MPSAWIAEAMQAQGHARRRAGVRAHANVRRPVGVQLGSLAEWAAMRQPFMVRSRSVVLADAPSLFRRFAGSRRPRIAAPRWGTSRSGSEA